MLQLNQEMSRVQAKVTRMIAHLLLLSMMTSGFRKKVTHRQEDLQEGSKGTRTSVDWWYEREEEDLSNRLRSA